MITCRWFRAAFLYSAWMTIALQPIQIWVSESSAEPSLNAKTGTNVVDRPLFSRHCPHMNDVSHLYCGYEHYGPTPVRVGDAKSREKLVNIFIGFVMNIAFTRWRLV